MNREYVPTPRLAMEVDYGRESVPERVEGRGVDPYSFYVVRVPENVFSTDPEETLRVRYLHVACILCLYKG